MDKYRRLADLLKGRQPQKEVFFTATFVGSQGDICSIDIDGLILDDVRLRPTTIEADNKVLVTPMVGSSVLVGSMSGELSNLFIISADSVSEYSMVIGDVSILINEKGIVMNGGSLGGMVKVENLTSRLNAIEKEFNKLLNDYKVHNHTHPQGSTTGLLVQPSASQLALTERVYIENEIVRQ